MRAAASAGKLPPVALGAAARRLVDGRDPKAAKRLLEPLFRGALEALNERHEEALDVLCDAYGALDEPRKKQALLELALNPTDNHGLRAPLVNLLLRRGRDDDALELIGQYAEDLEPAIRFGAVLAWYRKGDLGRAARELEEAMRYMPLVPEYLISARKAEPKLSQLGVTAGGPDEAWLYRAEMREVWASVPGLLDWLKRAAR